MHLWLLKLELQEDLQQLQGSKASPSNSQDEEQAVPIQGQEPLTASMLAATPTQEQKQKLGKHLFPLVQIMCPDLTWKITGKLLEIDHTKLLHMLEDHISLKEKVSPDNTALLSLWFILTFHSRSRRLWPRNNGRIWATGSSLW